MQKHARTAQMYIPEECTRILNRAHTWLMQKTLDNFCP